MRCVRDARRERESLKTERMRERDEEAVGNAEEGGDDAPEQVE